MNTSLLSRSAGPAPSRDCMESRWPDVPREVRRRHFWAALMIPLKHPVTRRCRSAACGRLYAAIIAGGLRPAGQLAPLVTSPTLPWPPWSGPPRRLRPARNPLRLSTPWLGMVCALLFFIFWIFRLAFLANFLSRAVMAGFITGLGVEVSTKPGPQNPRCSPCERRHVGPAGRGRTSRTLATSVNTEGFISWRFLALIHSIPHANLYSVAMAGGFRLSG